MKTNKLSFARFFDEYVIAGQGLLLALKKKSFWIPFVITFFVFGTIINLLSSGFTSIHLIGGCLSSGDFGGAFRILSGAFLGIFGVGRTFLDWLLNFVLILFQSILVALVVIVARHNRAKKQSTKTASKNKETKNEKIPDSSAGLESSAIVAGLVVLGSGCPTCGTTLLAPVIGAVLSGTTGAIRLAGTISLILNILAIILAIFVFRKLGLETYAIIKSEQYKEKHHESHS